MHLRHAITTYPGETFVVRTLSPKRLFGGGVVGGGAAESAGESVAPEVEALGRALAANALVPHSAAELGAIANIREDRAAQILGEFAASGTARRLQKPLAFVDGAAADALSVRIRTTLERREAEHAWTLGMTRSRSRANSSATKRFWSAFWPAKSRTAASRPGRILRHVGA